MLDVRRIYQRLAHVTPLTLDVTNRTQIQEAVKKLCGVP